MENKYLIDTNILIYYLDGKIPVNQSDKVSIIIETSFNISTITKIEILGWQKITDNLKARIDFFLLNANVIYVNKEIERATIEIGRAHV